MAFVDMPSGPEVAYLPGPSLFLGGLPKLLGLHYGRDALVQWPCPWPTGGCLVEEQEEELEEMYGFKCSVRDRGNKVGRRWLTVTGPKDFKKIEKC